VAAIASSRIASGGSVFHKPQSHDAGTANGAGASSPFDQLLATAPPCPAPADRNSQDKPDPGKKAAKDSKSAGKSSQPQQDAKNQVATVPAGSKTPIQVAAAHDDSQDDAAEINSSDTAAAASRQSAPSGQQAAPDANQTLAAAQSPLPIPDEAASGSAQDVNNNSNPVATLPVSDQSAPAAPAQAVPAGNDDITEAASGSTTDAAATSSAIEVSKSGKTKPDGKSAADIPADTASQSAASVSKKDHRSDKSRKQDETNAANTQPAATPDPTVAAAIVAATPAPAPATANSDPSPDDAIAAAAQAGPAKAAPRNSHAGSNPPANVKPPALNDAVSGNTSNSGPQATPTGSPPGSQDGSAMQGNNAPQNADNKPAGGGDKTDRQVAAAVQPQPQTQPAQPPAQTAIPAVQPAMPAPGHMAATAPVTQNIQITQSDSGANANTMSALAVAIAAKSQSGNKQFDIRLDPPELGRVEVRLSIDSTGKAQASLSADQPRTLDLLKTDAPMLTRALRDAGLNVSQDGLNFSLRGQDRHNGGNSFMPRPGRASPLSLTATSAIGAVHGGAHYQGPADGRLDIRV